MKLLAYKKIVPFFWPTLHGNYNEAVVWDVFRSLCHTAVLNLAKCSSASGKSSH